MNTAIKQAGLMVRAGHYQGAIEILDQLLSLHPDDANILYQKGVALFLAGRAEEGIRLVTRASCDLYENAKVHHTLAGMLVKMGRWREAARAAHQALALRPTQFSSMGKLVATLATWCRHDGKSDRPTPPTIPLVASNRLVSVITCSIDQRKETKAIASYQKALAGVRTEFITIGKVKSLSEGYNQGIDLSSGDIIIFSHDDVEVLSPFFAEWLLLHLTRFDLVGAAGTSRLVEGSWAASGWPWIHGMVVQPASDRPHYMVNIFNTHPGCTPGIQAMDGLFIAVNRRVVERIRFDATSFDGFHLYDLDFTFAAWRAGFELAVCNDFLFLHESSGNYDERWSFYRDRFMAKYQGQ